MTHIWVPKVGILEGEAKFFSGRVAGEYTLTKRKADTGMIVQEVGPFSNLITNAGLERAGTGQSRNGVMVGTGSTPPSVSDTQLQSFLAYTSSTAPAGSWNGAVAYGGSPDYWVQGVGTWRFAAGGATGNISEVGIGWLEGSGTDADRHRLFSRALIVDALGSPITITVLPDEVLDVTYALRHYPAIANDVEQEVTISGVPYEFVTRNLALEDSSYHQVASGGQQRFNYGPTACTGTAAGTPPALNPDITSSTNMLNRGAIGQFDAGPQAYAPGSKSLSAVLSASLTQANLAYGIRGLTLNIRNSANPGTGFIVTGWQSTITPAIPKNNTNVLSFGASFSWDRYTP